ncbi:malonate decarboxylase acyl carrier protein [Dactylosporangium siamense]|uniref:Malonate decarboxylase acyl carrier protein n=1 Tax=Dactylosporangium siamense TaxID=685454 RepID=A0A919UC49_9ACTN|nr:malonate decarboxylase acyl carrier protein [Dactylosporangium siamense]GIG45313.1 malonate decarboxylase acyl carrier protein [Dactylosporangium siamense]
MRTLHFTFPATVRAVRRAHVGVVGSGDLEVLFEPTADDVAVVRVRTSVEGFDEVWRSTLQRFFARTPVRGSWELNDAAATPALVTLRLQQAAHEAGPIEEAS